MGDWAKEEEFANLRFTNNVTTYHVQQMIDAHRKDMIDFAYLKFNDPVGKGATSKVYRGKYMNKVVAIKTYTPLEITFEEIKSYSEETAINSLFCHPSIVEFYGLSVYPPYVALVFEFMEHGALDEFMETERYQSFSIADRLK